VSTLDTKSGAFWALKKKLEVTKYLGLQIPIGKSRRKAFDYIKAFVEKELLVHS
jgi:hypothetical protein